ncbi:helical backbone metal receptor [Desulfogranum marinum]|uniref:helical backbone metal receptor n=1 Tax=Desulfogranum marinum TaxID=453220 RepID=UPI0029C626C5|nr:helical backbone metal receptor [Desulfogranum marinum]
MSDCIQVTDDLGQEITVPFPPQRIISAVPSTTEFLFDLGLGDRVVSRTRFCRYPEQKIQRLPNIGGPKSLDEEKIAWLKPDLILANEEENDQAQIEALMEKYCVYVSKIRNVEDAYNNIVKTGKITGCEAKAREMVKTIQADFAVIPKRAKKMKALYLIWKDPYMCVSRDTFVNSMLEVCGFENCITDGDARYPVVTAETIKGLNPELILLSSEPFPFAEKHKKEFQQIVPGAKIELVDGEMFAWYESHLLQAGGYFTALIKKIH